MIDTILEFAVPSIIILFISLMMFYFGYDTGFTHGRGQAFTDAMRRIRKTIDELDEIIGTDTSVLKNMSSKNL